MSPAFPARRRAEQFDAMVEGTSTTSRDAASGDLLELVSTLRNMPRAEARPEFVVALRERLMLAADAELTLAHGGRATTGPVIRPRRSHRDRRLATALGGFALVGATASMAVAAQSALPGDELYPMKRAMENAHAHLSVGDDAKGATLLANASGRLAEIDELTHGSHADDADADVITATLAAFTDQATEASDLLLDSYAQDGDEDSISELTKFTDSSLDILDELAPDVPADARDALAEARQTIASIKGAAADACPLCAAVLSAEAIATTPGPSPVAHPHPTLPVDIVRPPSVLTIPHTAVPTPADQPAADDPSAPPTTDPTVAPATEQPTVTPQPDATGLPSPSPTAQGEPGGTHSGEDDNPVRTITKGIPVSNPADPAAAMSDAAEAMVSVVDGVTGLIGGGGHKPRAGAQDGGGGDGPGQLAPDVTP